MQNLFLPADILLPKKQFDLQKYSVVACDQYTSEPEIWKEADEFVGDSLSTLRMIFPEVYLNDGEEAFEKRIASINRAMQDALSADAFDCYENCYFYIERTQRNGAVRRGIIGRVDLEGYDFARSAEDDPQVPIRATEGTVLSRIPPRVRIRKDAPLELPHVMLLVDDPSKQYIEKLGEQKSSYEKVYDFDLMQQSGHLTGWKLPAEAYAVIDEMVEALSNSAQFAAKYHLPEDSGKKPLVFAVGDGNHSLATARQCWDNIKQGLSEEEFATHPARYALCELCNLHDDALVFEPVHRIVFGVDPKQLLAQAAKQGIISGSGEQSFEAVIAGEKQSLVITNPTSGLTVGSLQNFLDSYCKAHGGQIDYIHGAQVVEALSQQENSIGFLLPCMEKEALYPTVIQDKALPRKTFSMGDAWDKRFYCEARHL